jgi:V8-like Glu-specific endopeptidase
VRPLLLASLATIAIVLTSAAPAGAILDGTPDTDHPYVGIMVTVVEGQRVPVCSGFLVSPTVYVTAAHCVHALGGTLPAYVSFDQAFTPSSVLRPGTAVANPDFRAGGSAHEIALVLLDEEVTELGYAELPGLGLLGASPKKNSLTVVGYGADVVKGGYDFQLVRSFGDARISKLQKDGFNLRMSSGICFGDSGGPVLLGGSDVAVGINSYVNNRRCAGNAFAFRLDTDESLRFLAPYL